MIKIEKFLLPVDKLYQYCDPDLFNFDCTKNLAPLREFIGQDRAIGALEFGLSMNHEGYNIYVAGLAGTGKTTAVKTHIDKILKAKKISQQLLPPPDACYLYNFADSDRPQIVNLPQKRGKSLQTQINDLLQKLKEELTKAFSSENYKAERKNIIEAAQDERQKLALELKEEAQRQGFSIQVTQTGQAIFPMVNGRPISEEEYGALSESAKKELEIKRDELLKKLQATYEVVRELEKKAEEKLQNVDKSIAGFTISRLFDDLIHNYSNFEDVQKYLLDLKQYTLDNLDLFKEKEGSQPEPFLGIPASYLAQGRDPFLPFKVNVFVDNSETRGSPVIVESNPNYTNLFGKIERRFLLGGYLSDHTMLKAGSLHMANGGYLLLNASDVLTNPGVWQTLKRTIKTKEIRIEEPLEGMGLIAPQGLRPQPMPINVKVLLIGDTMLYQLLSMYDEEFWEIFKVKADFDYQIDKTRKNMMHYAAFIAGCCDKCEIQHFDNTGVARVVECSSRFVGDQQKLSARFAQIRELVQESAYWAQKDHSELVSARHVDKAVEQRFFRHNLPCEHIQEMIDRGIIMIDVKGKVVGQLNGLSVYSLGDISFGKPSRITCKTYLGRGGIINIERESQLSGRIHDKGVLILSGYLGWKYAQDKPLSLSASLCFEQSYEGVEGDSASSTELYALISSLANIPLKQNIAVTGSVNQKGEIQAIGGVNQKIEGFFRICKAKGLTGDQGVMIPQQNITNLMLKQEVIDAVKKKRFHIYAVSTVDEGLEVLTDLPAGKKRKDGMYPKDTINYYVNKHLGEMATTLKRFAESEIKTSVSQSSGCKCQ